MDILQIALILLIMLLGVFLSILGFQVFLILKDLRKSLDKLDMVLSDVEKPACRQVGPAQAAAQITQKITSAKNARRLFKRKE